jgi:hypothetical protein
MNDRSSAAPRRSARRKWVLFAGIPATLAMIVAIALIVAGGTLRPAGTGTGDDQAFAENSATPGDPGAPASAGPASSGPASASPRASASKPSPSATSGAAGPGPASGGGACPLPDHPKPSCTGVPAGTRLTRLPLNVDNDSYAVRRAGTVIENKHIAGNLLVWADNITIRNSQIDGTVYNDQGSTKHPYTITDSTVGLASKCITSPGLLSSNYTARRVKVLGHDDGFRVDTPGHVAIYDSYAKLCWNPPSLAPPDGSHSGGIQADCTAGTCYDSVFIHNTIDNRGPKGNSGMTFMSFDGNPISGWTANDNLVMGGSYTVIFWWTGGPKYQVHNNRVVKNEWAYGPADARGSCAHQDWSGNTLVTINADYDITKTVAPLPCVN